MWWAVLPLAASGGFTFGMARPPMSFDRLAPVYRAMEFVLAGGKLQRCRLAWLREAAACRNVLIVGEGPGRFLTECVRALPDARILCVDASRAMLERARHALRKIDSNPVRVKFLHAALPEWQPPPRQFDLIVTHFFLYCFPAPQLQAVIAGLAAGARPGALWLLADFCVPERGLARWRARLVLALAYAFFQVATRLPARRLVAPEDYLIEQGFQLKRRKSFDGGLLHSDLWEYQSLIS